MDFTRPSIENQIDHIDISSAYRRSLQDVRSKRGADVGTDHHLVTGKIKFKLKGCHPTAANPGSRYNTELLKHITTMYSFQLELANRYQLLSNHIEDDATVEQVWQQSKSAWKETCEKYSVREPDNIRLDFSRNLGEGSRKEAEKGNNKQQQNNGLMDG